MKNLIPADYRKFKILCKIGEAYYFANKCGSTWNVGKLENTKIFNMTQDPPTPWILIEFGEYLHYERYNRILANVTYPEVKKVFQQLSEALK